MDRKLLIFKKMILFFIYSISLTYLLNSIESISELLKSANKYYHDSKFGKAIEYYTKIIELDPGHADAYYSRGKSYEYMGNDNLAVKDYFKAIELKKEYKNILLDLGGRHYYQRDYDRALFYFMNDIDINPENKRETMIFLKKNKVFNLTQNFKIKVKGKTGKLKIIAIIPGNYDKRQKIHNIEYSIKPTKEFIDDNINYVEYFIEDPTGDINININTDIEIFEYDFKHASKKEDGKEVNSSELWPYLIDEKYLEKDDPSIQTAAKRLTAKNELETVKKTYDFVLKHMKYRFLQGPDKGAVYALKNKGDDCSEYSDLFVALCRANNIPARVVSGFILKEGLLDWGHAWAEVYFKEFGWIPFDPTFDDNDGKINTTDFENLTNVYIYLKFTRIDENLNKRHSVFFDYAGDKIDFDYNVKIKNTPKENYYYFYHLISSYKNENNDEFKYFLNEIIKDMEKFQVDEWEYSIARYFTDQIALDEFISLAEENKEKLCEAYCFIGYKYLFNNDLSNADIYFDKCLKTEEKDQIEYLLVTNELKK